MSNKTLQDVINTPPDQYVSGEWEAYVTGQSAGNSKKTGKPFYNATLTDGGTGMVEALSFSASFAPLVGKKVRIGGMGVKRSADYQGMAKVMLGDRATITVVGDGAGAGPAPQPQGNTYTAMKPQATLAPINPALRIADYGSLFKLCLAEAGKTADACGYADNQETVRSIASGFFIQGCKEGLHTSAQ